MAPNPLLPKTPAPTVSAGGAALPVSPAPLPDGAVEWYDSRAFRALAQTSVLTALGWLAVSLTTNTWDWRVGLALPILSNVIVNLTDMWSPTVKGPLAMMNKKNVGG